jgi:putative ABC transport system ATP-binding protein
MTIAATRAANDIGVDVRLAGVVHLYPSPEGDVVALRGVDLDIEAGEAIALLGPSGAGKSTMLSLLAGEFKASAGVVRVGSNDLGKMSEEAVARLRSREISLVVQGAAANLLPYVTSVQNVAFAQYGARKRGARIDHDAHELLSMFSMESIADVPAERLSAGELQRLALVSGVAVSPRLFLVDEPTSQLDPASRDVVTDTLIRIHEELGMTLVVVTHETEVAARFSRTLTILDGRIGAEGRHGRDYALIGRDGTLRLTDEALELVPPGSLVRVMRRDDRIELLLTDESSD